jgi:hypothetical protein
VNQTACTNTEPRTSVLIGPSETAEQGYDDTETGPDTKAGADFAARVATRDVVGEWLLTLAPGYGMAA